MDIETNVVETPEGYLATAPDFPECQGVGQSAEEALRILQGEILAWIEVAHQMGFPVPDIH